MFHSELNKIGDGRRLKKNFGIPRARGPTSFGHKTNSKSPDPKQHYTNIAKNTEYNTRTGKYRYLFFI